MDRKNDAVEKVDRALLKKYDRPGPRYTSYPTVPEWSSNFGPDDYRQVLAATSKTDSGLSLYFHLPFCRARCLYCGCTTVVTSNAGRVDKYLTRLETEMNLVTQVLGRHKRVIQLHWGGGTPTHLSADQIRRLHGSIAGHFSIVPEAEIAIEVDPRVTTDEQLQLLRELGFNRISLGVQDLTPQVQAAIGRNQTAEQTIALFKRCRELGFGGINIDLIYGLPYQTVDNFASTIDEVITLGADRVAVYSFAYLPEIRPHQKRILPEWLPLADTKYELFSAAVERFLGAGYVQIGMDHFALPQDEMAQALARGRLHRNFMGYTVRPASESIGFGMSAISEFPGAFAQNLSTLETYAKAIDAGQPATFRGWRLSDDDRIRQRAILSLMCNFILEFAALDRAFKIDSKTYFALELAALKPFIADGLVMVTDAGVTVLRCGKVFVRNVAMIFDAYLRAQGEEKQQVFSRTI